MKTVFRYALPIDSNFHTISFTGKIVSYGIKDGEDFISIWAEVDETDVTAHHTQIFSVYGTGHPIPKNLKYRSTIISGYFVWHVYSVLD